ncbi:MAG TPA: flavodoxin domain-containing protein [Xanthomonadales bacterium]|nr:flavodoxin domain-containing protein [Xanthomonadales bacterium]
MFKALRTDNSPFSKQQIDQLQSSLVSLDAAQAAWLSGYIAGRLVASPEFNLPHLSPQVEQAPQAKFHVFYASQTGTGETIANELAGQLQQAGWQVDLQNMGSVRPAQLKKLTNVAIVISTHGEGDPPDDAIDWFDYLQSPRAPKLDSLNFTVLALGDRSYEKYCEAGRQLEQLLLATGARTFSPRIDCDLDYAENAGQWSGQVLDYAREQQPAADSGNKRAAAQHLSVVQNSEPGAGQWTRNHPFKATLERVQKITALESGKHVYHLELSLADSGIEYQPGDALGVWAYNNHETVSHILATLGIAADAEIDIDGHVHSAHELLVREREITRLSADTVLAYAAAAKQAVLQERFEAFEPADRRDFIEQRQFIDLVDEYPPQENARISLETLASLLRPLAPRSYSIASSRAEVDEEVHLTVATLYSNAIGTERKGVASAFLNHHLQAGDEVGVFLEPNKRFRLPENRQTPIILISAGTGIAPYRSFLQQLEQEEADTPVWMIFGNPHLRTDFLYQREWLDWRSKGLLQHIDCAFSRDQAEKVYVQHIVRQQGERLEQWLQNGAQIYLCGGLSMGKEVEQAVQDVLAEQRGLDATAAAEAFAELRRNGRILKDLY